MALHQTDDKALREPTSGDQTFVAIWYLVLP